MHLSQRPATEPAFRYAFAGVQSRAVDSEILGEICIVVKHSMVSSLLSQSANVQHLQFHHSIRVTEDLQQVRHDANSSFPHAFHSLKWRQTNSKHMSENDIIIEEINKVGNSRRSQYFTGWSVMVPLGHCH